ncbi:MAG: acetyl-CoA carboxylase biotin carboxylase subunit [Rhodobacteraceae bacterium]|jgi:acetyl-CoA/propionyl-CoA carboxylase biotin carboxyl carrier protein|nr:acetyl-CoA carboxylase biotin carboxylase subunit [Paracoccaceae bacterium]
MPFDKVLVANRGEIAIRVFRTLREMGIRSVAIYSEADKEAPHLGYADEAVAVGAAAPAESYLNIDRIVAAAKDCGAQAIHPGYGFLAERAAFAEACRVADIVFIGPSPRHIDLMGDKVRARRTMGDAGMPIVPGVTEPVATVEEATRIAAEIGYPVTVKAAAGGGGRGMRIARGPEEIAEAFTGAQGEGARFFGDATCYLERFLENPRHIEFQILADRHGNVIHLGERDCSIQRRNQKLIEESPAPTLNPAVRAELLDKVISAIRRIGYENAGTIECLAVGNEVFFLEMNTRIQVEHCVTEMVTGVDIVAEQIRLAAGQPLSVRQEDVTFRGHAIECRINAESAAKGFLPAPGQITGYKEPGGPGVRVDSAAEAGLKITPMYDSMIAKLVVHAADRDAATRRMLRALSEFKVGGIRTLIPFHKALLATPQWAGAQTCKDLTGDRAWLASIEEQS